MFYGQCNACGERWKLGTASTCKCPKPGEWIEMTYKQLMEEVQKRGAFPKNAPPSNKVELLRRAWDFIDTVKQAYPEHWAPEDQEILDGLMRLDLDLAGIKRKWAGLTDEEINAIYVQHHNQFGECISGDWGYERAIEEKLKEKNDG
jgi:hypothetical protein